MAVMRGNRVGGNCLTKWDEVKKFPSYTHRLMHRKRVTCELDDSYFCLMTIKHAISKIELATGWTLNYYITQSRRKSRQFPLEIGQSYRRDVVRKATSGRRGLGSLMSWGPGKLLIRCRKKAITQQSGPLGLRSSSPAERERHNADGHKSGGQNISVLFGLQLPLTRKPWVTLFEPLQ